MSIFANLLSRLGIRRVDLGCEEVTETGPIADREFMASNVVCEGNRIRAAFSGLAALALTVAVSSTACQRDTTASDRTAPAKPSGMRTVTVPVSGMICVVRAGRVETALKAVHGVQDFESESAAGATPSMPAVVSRRLGLEKWIIRVAFLAAAVER